MVFTSFNFLLFFPTVILIYYLLPPKFRSAFLLTASYFFYLNLKPIYALLLAGISLTTYFFTIWIEKSDSEKQKKFLLRIGLFLIILPLFFFKYFNFVEDGLFNLLSIFGLRLVLPEISWLLPIGISFYTFMAIGYLVDVYNEEIEAEKNLGYVALFLAFFPILLSGPIERAKNMFGQFRNRILLNTQNLEAGCRMMLWGYFMKLVVADRIALLVHAILNNYEHHSGHSIFMAVLLYPIQVYGDLGGYSLIAIGSAKIMGYDIIPNFRRPFFSTSMSEFWRRWHISLISWITDYIYIPLSYQLRRYKIWGIVMALMITFLIAGIWHGAGLVFILWGLIQGTFLSLEALTNKHKKKFVKAHQLDKSKWYLFLSTVFTYFLFAFSEIFGGATASTTEAFAVIHKIATDFSGPVFFDSPSMALFIIIGILILFWSEWSVEYQKNKTLFFNNKNWIVRAVSYTFLVIFIILTGVFDGGQFIYFKF